MFVIWWNIYTGKAYCTLAQLSISLTFSFSGSTSAANFRFFMVYSWPQKTFWKIQRVQSWAKHMWHIWVSSSFLNKTALTDRVQRKSPQHFSQIVIHLLRCSLKKSTTSTNKQCIPCRPGQVHIHYHQNDQQLCSITSSSWSVTHM